MSWLQLKLTILARFAQLLQDAWFPLLLLENSTHDKHVLLLLAHTDLVLVLPQVREVFHLDMIAKTCLGGCNYQRAHSCKPCTIHLKVLSVVIFLPLAQPELVTLILISSMTKPLDIAPADWLRKERLISISHRFGHSHLL